MKLSVTAEKKLALLDCEAKDTRVGQIFLYRANVCMRIDSAFGIRCVLLSTVLGSKYSPGHVFDLSPDEKVQHKEEDPNVTLQWNINL